MQQQFKNWLFRGAYTPDGLTFDVEMHFLKTLTGDTVYLMNIQWKWFFDEILPLALRQLVRLILKLFQCPPTSGACQLYMWILLVGS